MKSSKEFESWVASQPRDYVSVSRKFLPLLTVEEQRDIGEVLKFGILPRILDRAPDPLPFNDSSRVTYESKFRSSVLIFLGKRGGRSVKTKSRLRDSDSLEYQLSEAYLALARWPHLRVYLAPALLKAEQELAIR